MGTHSLEEAKKRPPELIDRALGGEAIIITRHDRPVAELKPIPHPARPVSAADPDWLAALRAKLKRAKQNAADFVSAVRDEGNR
jgi:antitoxin (DNA-binding transcriptional repressor) of toxin-antitoxin stability system